MYKRQLEKYRDDAFVDTLERHARDAARKLGPEERLVGPAALCLKHGREPVAYARAIAAAAAYRGSDDPGTRRVQELLEAGGIGRVLTSVCECAEGATLYKLVETAWSERQFMLSK